MPKILNLTQHPATPDQVTAGVYEPQNKKVVQQLLTFDSLPTREEVEDRAKMLAVFAVSDSSEVPSHAMIAGAGYLLPALEKTLKSRGIIPVHAFSQRVSVEVPQPDGSVKKENVFRHVGFVGMD